MLPVSLYIIKASILVPAVGVLNVESAASNTPDVTVLLAKATGVPNNPDTSL